MYKYNLNAIELVVAMPQNDFIKRPSLFVAHRKTVATNLTSTLCLFFSHMCSLEQVWLMFSTLYKVCHTLKQLWYHLPYKFSGFCVYLCAHVYDRVFLQRQVYRMPIDFESRIELHTNGVKERDRKTLLYTVLFHRCVCV